MTSAALETQSVANERDLSALAVFPIDTKVVFNAIVREKFVRRRCV